MTSAMHDPSPEVKISFEFFPPKTEKMEARLWDTIEQLAPLAPEFLSVTYGAGGSTRERTHATVERIRRNTTMEPAAHLTCVGASRSEIDAVARRYWEAGVRHIVALRGDPAPDADHFEPHPDGYRSAADLVAGLKRIADFRISVACHPETHPEAASPAADLDNLKAKVDAGADRAITQYFFEPDVYLRFRDRVQAAGIEVPLEPGVMPITHFEQVLKFSRMCGATVPGWLRQLFDGLDETPETRQLVAASVASELCQRLQKEDVNEFHFYTLNRATLSLAICRMLGVRPTSVGPALTISGQQSLAG